MMEALTLLVPVVATVALGGALLVPIRDGRAGRKATLDGRSPLLADFRKLAVKDDTTDVAAVPTESDVSTTIETTAVTHEKTAENEFDPLDFFRNLARRMRPKHLEPVIDGDVVNERSFAEELSSLFPSAAKRTHVLHEFTEGSQMNERGHEASEATVDAPTVSVPVSVPVPVPIVTTEAAPANVRIDQPHDVRPTAIRSGRVVPLTRLPLRHQSKDVTWPGLTSPPRTFATLAERYAFLRAGAHEERPVAESILALAFREETPEGRALALAALRRPNASKEAIETFAEALGTGSDDERSLAVDALSEAGARDEIARGVTDRIDAIAAKAALAYVGTTARDDYHTALSPLIDETRVEAILALLAGVVE